MEAVCINIPILFKLTHTMQPPDVFEMISTASERVLESNGHFLRIRMLAEQRTSELIKAGETLTKCDKEIYDLRVQLQTLK